MKTIIEMAQECGLIGMRPHLDGIYQEALVQFSELIRADERDALIHYFTEHWRSYWSDSHIIEAIESIEARS